MIRKRIAIIADIHGNLPALQAVIEDLEQAGVDEVLVGGDLVGRGPLGKAIVDEVRRRGWQAVRGNHEDYLLDFHHRRVPEEWWTREEWSAARWMTAELSAADFSYLESLPLTLASPIAPSLLLVHGTPRSHSEGLGPWTSDSKLDGLLADLPFEILVCAHTHRQMHRILTSGHVVNTGSVGLPFNGDPRAQYAVLEHSGGEWHVDLRAVDYDIEEILDIYETSGFAAAGGVTARLLRLELTHAAPFLVPFLKWTDALSVDPTIAQLDAFLDVYDPGEPVHEFFGQLDAALRERFRKRR